MTPPTDGPATSSLDIGQPISAQPISSVRTRSGFALTGQSVALDPATHAVRPDLADIRLAGQVFAPHFAAAIPCRAIRPVVVTARRGSGAAVVALQAGDRFEMLEVAGSIAWGIATEAGLVGYLDRDALEADA